MGCGRQTHDVIGRRRQLVCPFQPRRLLRPAIAATCASSPQRCATTNKPPCLCPCRGALPTFRAAEFSCHCICVASPFQCPRIFFYLLSSRTGGGQRSMPVSRHQKPPPTAVVFLCEQRELYYPAVIQTWSLRAISLPPKFAYMHAPALFKDRLSENRPSVLLVSLHDHCACSKV